MKLIADNLRITRPKIRRALQQLDPEPVQAVRVSSILAKEDIFSWGMVP
jgi:hypothetical protein